MRGLGVVWKGEAAGFCWLGGWVEGSRLWWLEWSSASGLMAIRQGLTSATGSTLCSNDGESHGVGSCWQTTAVVRGLPDGRMGRTWVLLRDML